MQQEVKVGSVVEGKVTGITGFGAFVRLPDGRQGLVHISEIALEYVKDVRDHLQENQTVKVKVLSEEKGKVCLSIKKVLEAERKEKREAAQKHNTRPTEIDWSRPAPQNLSFEEKMSRFKSDSEERISDFKKSVDNKRSGGYKRSANTY
ncbi:MAG: S1 RNA-binding domain-containing protein [Clostridia bacterium]|nr:S1 RNA-binding domain-containing protein [Clostridia bacterium]